jgi:hypothetical protein
MIGVRQSAEMQRLRPVACGQRTHGWCYLADLQFSGLRWSAWQLYEVLPTQPAPALGQTRWHPVDNCCSPRRTDTAGPLRSAASQFDHPESVNRCSKSFAGTARGPVLRDPQLAIGAATENAGPKFLAIAE